MEKRLKTLLVLLPTLIVNSFESNAQAATAMEQTGATVLPTKHAIVLYCDQVAKSTGVNRKDAAHYVINGNSSFSWQKEIAEAGTYEMAVTYSAKKTGTLLTIVSGKDTIKAGLAVTNGYYPASSTDWYTVNFERRQVPGKVYLQKGMAPISIQLTGTADGTTSIYSVELIPSSKKALVQKDLALAAKNKPNAKWFTESPYGLMFHWTSESTPRTGPLKPYNEAVKDFDIPAFVKMVQQTGASYVIFTTNHAEPYFPAPLKSWEKEFPAHTTQRDLVAELADALNQHNIKLVLYFATHVYARFDKVDDAEFERLNTTLLTEIGDRYKDKVAGYWLDGWYQCYAKHPSFDFEHFYKVCKTGNANRLLSLNSWTYPTMTRWQDYFSGEFYTLGQPSTEKVLSSGPGTGLYTQNLIVMETDNWLHTSLNTPIAPPTLNAKDLSNFINQQKGKGPVTINIQIYQDGTISEGALNVMETVNKTVNKTGK